MENKLLLDEYQQYEICSAIGEWYLIWKDNLVNYDLKTHNLGSAKEHLKQMICDLGDNRK